ncbi:MAG TPA: hypothetical protein VMH27_01870 [Puia sp.]|nr:hypothetical protein [Puia sp.]
MMYLLLRDNKQSGPYSLDELKAKGLKAYDLVWVEGRSAAWRYPSEIEEMKAFAPAVEEQPFDRFFKKPTAVTMTQPASASNPTVVKRTIYVTMPGGIVARENTRDTSPANDVIREITPVREAHVPAREVTPLRERMSYLGQPETEILPPPPGRKVTKIWIPVGIGAGMVVLLAVGIFIGLSIQKDSGNVQKLTTQGAKNNQQALVRTTAQQMPVNPVNQVSNPADNPAAAPNKSLAGNNAGTYAVAATPVQETTALPTDKAAIKPRTTGRQQKTEAQKTPADVPAGPPTDLQAVPLVAHREAVHRTDAVQSQPADDREGARAILANEVSVGTNKYDVGTFGGIHNLQVTVTNRSAYSLDLVVVAVSYIQANKKTYKTENLYFRGIGPGSALMLEAPKSSRGISVQYKVTSINSKELGLSEPGI